eukprot:423117-Rhodomonas_salina.1
MIARLEAATWSVKIDPAATDRRPSKLGSTTGDAFVTWECVGEINGHQEFRFNTMAPPSSLWVQRYLREHNIDQLLAEAVNQALGKRVD